jgi:anti-sigma factor RsiW
MSACTHHQLQLASLAAHRDSKAPDAALAAHLATCPACRRLASDLEAVSRHLDTAAASPPPTSLPPRIERAVARAIREPQRSARQTIGWWIALPGAAAMLVLLFGNGVIGKRTRAVEVSSSAQPAATFVRSAEEPQLNRYQSAFRQSDESLNALLDAGTRASPLSLRSETMVALRPTSRIE